MTPEGKVKQAVKKILDGVHAFWYMPMGNRTFSQNGVPDFIVCLHGDFIGIETKANGNTPTALQKRQLQRIEAAGGVSWVVSENNLDDFRKWVYEKYCAS